MSKTVHLIGIAGSAMTSLAGMFLEQGWKVQGSDQNFYPPSSEVLAKLSIKTFHGFSKENLTPTPDLVIVGNVVSASNPEAQHVKEKNIPYLSMSGALYEYFLQTKDRFVITGTHGKTTTTSLLAWIFTSAGKDPGFFLGGSPLNFEAGYRIGKGSPFVIEGDEYDTAYFEKTPKFLHYGPQYVGITSVEFDHADIYRDLDHVKEQFVKLIHLVPSNGVVVANADDPNVRDVVQTSKKDVRWFGLEDRSGFFAKDLINIDGGKSFTLCDRNQEIVRIDSPLIGLHNVRNVLVAGGLAHLAGIPAKEIKKGVESFRGVKKRQQRIGESGGVAVYEDFAHHPTAIEQTIDAFLPMTHARGGKLWAIFEPRSNTTRRNVFQDQFPRSLAKADHSILAAVFSKNDSLKADQLLDPQKIVQVLRNQGKDAQTFSTDTEILDHVVAHAENKDVVVFMSNGDFSNLPRRLCEALQ
ncbi:MAG: Mur ligase family protein [Bdellovibrionota bacterium]